VQSEPAQRIDGRRARGERSRAAVVEALLDLIEEGDPAPTAERVAVRAGVSLRLVFHYFADLESLHAAAAECQFERIAPLLRPLSDAGPFAARLDAFVRQRAMLWERIAPVRRVSLLREAGSPEIRRRLAQAAELERGQIACVFRREIEARRGHARAILSHALEAAASFQSWEQLRRRQGLSVEQAQAVLRFTLRAIFRGQPPTAAP
jgi:TetR/AcrR family transcriptional regulator of autoinduction and epiphytic fitness